LAVRTSLSGIAIWGELDECPDTGYSTATTITAVRALSEKTESQDSHAGTNRIQGSCWNGG
jgi:hypothetical protein